MPPQPGQKTIPLADWNRFLRMADWFDRTHGHRPPGALRPVPGHDLIVKIPSGGISSRSDTAVYSATCAVCVLAETTTPGQHLLHETDEETVVYNFAGAIVGESYVKTSLTANGVRYAKEAGVYWGKLDAALAYDETTGVAVSIWTDHALSDSGHNITNVLPPPLMASGELASGSWVKIEFINERWYVTGAPC